MPLEYFTLPLTVERLSVLTRVAMSSRPSMCPSPSSLRSGFLSECPSADTSAEVKLSKCDSSAAEGVLSAICTNDVRRISLRSTTPRLSGAEERSNMESSSVMSVKVYQVQSYCLRSVQEIHGIYRLCM